MSERVCFRYFRDDYAPVDDWGGKRKIVGFYKRFPFDRARSYHRVLLIKRVPENTEYVRSCRSPFTVLLHFVMRSTSTDETVASKMFRKEQPRVFPKHSR